MAEDESPFLAQRKDERKIRSADLILHDVGTKKSLKQEIEAFKEGKIDLLIVYNMLLTGFDARRLKKLYLGRLIKTHNLLQARARELNRRYQLLRFKYASDAKYAHLHKRLLEKHPLSGRERKLFEALSALKEQADDMILHNTQLLQNEAFASKEMLRLVIHQLKSASDLGFDPATMKEINRFMLKEYLDQVSGTVA